MKVLRTKENITITQASREKAITTTQMSKEKMINKILRMIRCLHDSNKGANIPNVHFDREIELALNGYFGENHVT